MGLISMLHRGPEVLMGSARWVLPHSPTLHTNRLWRTIYSAELCSVAAPGLEPNEASNSQISFNHFFNWRRLMEM